MTNQEKYPKDPNAQYTLSHPSINNLVNNEASNSSISSKNTSYLYPVKSNLSFSSFATQRGNNSPSMISPLNINLANSLLSTPIVTTPSQIFSPSGLSVSNLVSAGSHYTSSAVQKSLSTLDVKSMTRDISMAGDTFSIEESWPSLVVRVLPLFNGERLAGSVEDLNESVRTCLKSKDIATFSKDIYNDLLSAGMFTINAKLAALHEDKVVSRVVELWSFFLGTVLPYLEGVFLPHQIELSQLKRISNLSTVRTMALSSFKKQVIVPFMDRLEAAITQLFKEEANAPTSKDDTAGKLLQMMSILNMTPALEDQEHQLQFDHISTLLKNKWKENLRRT